MIRKNQALFSFGHGLSYTTFEFGKAKADKTTMSQDDKITFTVSVKNTGKKQERKLPNFISVI
jgi:beta-glucosidase